MLLLASGASDATKMQSLLLIALKYEANGGRLEAAAWDKEKDEHNLVSVVLDTSSKN